MLVQTLYLSRAIFNLTVSPDNNVQWNGHAYSCKSHPLAAIAMNVMKSSISRIFGGILSAQPKLVISQVRLMLQELPTTCVSKLSDGCTNWLTLEER